MIFAADTDADLSPKLPFMKHISLIFWGYFLAISAFSQSIVYVTPTGAGDHSGNTWSNALSGVQLPNRVATADSGTQFWIAAGTYKPTTTTNRTASFSIASGVSVYGGFAGTETALEQRIFGSNETVFSGDIGNIEYPGDNSMHVITLFNARQTISLNSLTIQGGQIRYSSDLESSGAGILIDITSDTLSVSVTSCRFINNTINGSLTGGGAIAVITHANSHCNVTIKNCHFSNNIAGFGGAYTPQTLGGTITSLLENSDFIANEGLNESGAISNRYVTDSPLNSLTIRKCNFFSNKAQFSGGAITSGYGQCLLENCVFNSNSVLSAQYTFGGGAVDNSESKVVFKNCIFINNIAPYGGAVFSAPSTKTTYQKFINCIFSRNSANVSGGVFYDRIRQPFLGNHATITTLMNCIIWENSAPDSFSSILSATYSLIQNGYSGIGNLNSDPLFVDPANGNFRLQPSSPAINAGSPDITDLLPTDIAGNPRVQGNRVDMGAYEFIDCSICPPFIISRIR
ncbi:MAG: hypothetical protein BGO59_27190 [Spirosoma sp. 48-14]|nr:MAG: hypothetical protein BGO59_27190 [Spirosoma sp. 48-14]